MGLDKSRLDDRRLEQIKYAIFKTIFDSAKEDDDLKWLDDGQYDWLIQEGYLSTIFLGYITGRINEIFHEERKKSAEIFDVFYPSLLDKMKKLSLELGLKNSLEISNLYSYLLWNGYLSKTGNNVYCVDNRKLLEGLYFADIMDGIGVCLNHAEMLKDFLCRCGYSSAMIINNADKNAKADYRMDIERVTKKDSKRIAVLNFLLKPLIKKMGNHAFTLINDRDGLYIYDSTNLMLLRVSDSYHAEVVNGSGNFKLHPYFSHIDISSSLEEKCIDMLFDTGSYECPYSKDEFITTSEGNLELFRDNISLLGDFYNEAHGDIISISEATDRIKVRKKGKK